MVHGSNFVGACVCARARARARKYVLCLETAYFSVFRWELPDTRSLNCLRWRLTANRITTRIKSVLFSPRTHARTHTIKSIIH